MITDAQIKEMTLAEYLTALNNITKEWVAEDPENRWAGLLTEDLDHWAEYEITTAWGLALYLDGCCEEESKYD